MNSPVGSADTSVEMRHVYCIRQSRDGEWWYYTGELRNGVAHFVLSKDDAIQLDKDEAESEIASDMPPERWNWSPAEIAVLHSYRARPRKQP